MARTRRIDLTGGVWVTLTSNATFAAIQLQTTGPVYIHVGASTPSEGDPGLILVADETREISFSEIETNDTIYAFTQDAGEAVALVDNGS